MSAGIERTPRRPRGWLPPGPPPRVPPDRPEVWPRAGEDLCHLAGDWRLLQRVRGHRWSLDDLVTAAVAAERAEAPGRLLDLGCGIGAVLLLLAWRFPEASCIGVETQPESVDLARRSIAWNGVDDRCEVRAGDLRDATLVPEGAVFELVTATPPYLPPGTATVPRRLQQAGCHIEERGGIESYCEAAARLVARRGRFVVCHAAGQRARAERAAATSGLRIESRLDVIPREGKAALFSVYTMRRSTEPLVADVPPPLVVRDANGDRTEAFRRLRCRMGMPP